eukprot:s1250_g2.t1
MQNKNAGNRVATAWPEINLTDQYKQLEHADVLRRDAEAQRALRGDSFLKTDHIDLCLCIARKMRAEKLTSPAEFQDLLAALWVHPAGPAWSTESSCETAAEGGLDDFWADGRKDWTFMNFE